MTSQDVADDLPDTQNADTVSLTQSQKTLSQQTTLTLWGRLCPLRCHLMTINMYKDAYTLGRSESCDIRLTSTEMREVYLNMISKQHFRIYKERVSNTNEIVVYLEDLSRNGTYVDKILIGHGKRIIIDHNSDISLSRFDLTVYRFENIIMPGINNLPLEIKHKYALGRKLGSGACGEVRLIFTKDGTQRFAVKTIQKCDFSSENISYLNNPEKIKNEIEILRKLKHNFIIQMKEICDTPKTVYIVLELMEGGELLERIKNRGQLSDSSAKLIFYQVIHAVNYLHKQGVTHRDLKPENILLADHSDITVAKVADFGLAKFVDAKTMMRTFCGTPMYVAPEILNNLGRSSYTNKVDVWSLGVILYVCLGGILPFTTQSKNYSLELQIKRGIYSFPKTYFDHVSRPALDLIKRMMTVDPNKRITVQQILQHPWLRDSNMQRTVNSLISPQFNENVAFNYHVNRQPETLMLLDHPPSKRPRLNM